MSAYKFMQRSYMLVLVFVVVVFFASKIENIFRQTSTRLFVYLVIRVLLEVTTTRSCVVKLK